MTAWVRDTWTNLERTTIQTLRELQTKGIVQVAWYEGDTQAVVAKRLHCYFIGMDRLADVSKLQGFSAGALVIEEPAPAADISGGWRRRCLASG